MTATDYRMARRNIPIGTAAFLICAPAIVRAASLMPVRGLPSTFLKPERKIPKTMAGARDFVHATSNQHGEKTASTTGGDPDSKIYRGKFYAKVRFTLDADDFEQWMTVVDRYPEWTPKMIKALCDRGHKYGSSPYSWYARAEPLPLDKVGAVHTMEYPDDNWRSFDRSVAEISTVQDGPDIMGVRIGDRIFFSDQCPGSGVATWPKPKSDLLKTVTTSLSNATARGLPSEASGATRSNGFHWSRGSLCTATAIWSSNSTARRFTRPSLD
jgi:hypothetical protein